MKIEKGMGRTRVGRFAAITVPAAVASAGLGVAILQGMVAATLTSADGFQLQTEQMQAEALAMSGTAIDTGGASAAESAVFADVEDAHLNGMCVGAKQTFGGPVGTLLGAVGMAGVGLTIDSSDDDVTLAEVALNAKELAASTGTTLGETNIGITADSVENVGESAPDAGDGPVSVDSAGVNGNQFALTALDDAAGYYVDANNDGAPDNGTIVPAGTANAKYFSENSLRGLDATSYAITLDGLALNDMKVTPTFLTTAQQADSHKLCL